MGVPHSLYQKYTLLIVEGYGIHFEVRRVSNASFPVFVNRRGDFVYRFQQSGKVGLKPKITRLEGLLQQVSQVTLLFYINGIISVISVCDDMNICIYSQRRKCTIERLQRINLSHLEKTFKICFHNDCIMFSLLSAQAWDRGLEYAHTPSMVYLDGILLI